MHMLFLCVASRLPTSKNAMLALSMTDRLHIMTTRVVDIHRRDVCGCFQRKGNDYSHYPDIIRRGCLKESRSCQQGVA